MPKNLGVDEITKMFYAVGFSSVPSWLKPYEVLSVGEKMRVDVARSLLSDDFVVFDEFTSTVDREVAKTCCLAVSKAVRKAKKQFIAVTCHKDVEAFLQPDWVFDTDSMRCFFGEAHARNCDSSSKDAGLKSGQNLAVITI